MKDKNMVLSAILISAFMFLSSMEKYQATTLPFISETVKPFLREQKGVRMAYKIYDVLDSKIYLDRDLLAKGYQPVQLTIQNNTANSFLIGRHQVSLPVATPSAVAWSVTKSTLPRSIGFKVLGFLFWPFMIPDTIDSVVTYSSHRDLKKDFAAKSIKENPEVVLPYSTTHRVMFVKKEDFNPNFSVSLYNPKTLETVLFDTEEMIPLPKEESAEEQTS